MSTLEAIPVREKSPEKKKGMDGENPDRHKDFDLEKPHESPTSVEDHKHADELLEKLKSKKFLEGDYSEKPKEPATFQELEAIHKKSIEQKMATTRKVVTNAVDFVPIIGSAKMIIEGLRGKQYGTEKEIKGYERFLHTTFGVGFLALDFTGLGAIGSELGKGVIKLGEHAALRTVEEIAAREIVKKESAGLTARGMVRIDRKEEIANKSE